jgi:hypothetical protein
MSRWAAPRCGRISPPVGEYYGLSWWATLLYGASSLLLIAMVVGFLAFFGVVIAQASGLAWLILLPVAGWALYAIIIYARLFSPVVLSERGFFVRAGLWWTEIPWPAVLRMRYAAFPYHIVYVRGGGPLPGFLFFPFLRRQESVFLVLGLRERRRLFEEIWRRASASQGRAVPVRGVTGGPPGGG